MQIKFIGHNTFQIKLNDGRLILTDPWLKRAPFWRAGKVLPGAKDISRCDFMLVSHNHVDHLDRLSLKIAKKLGTTIIGPESVIKRARRWKITNLINLTKTKEYISGDLKIHSVYARHTLSRDAMGFIITHEGKNIYFSGDTQYRDELIEDLKKYRINLAFVQIICFHIGQHKDGLNMDDAIKLAKEIKPNLTIPMHYEARFKVMDPQKFVNEAKKNGINSKVLNHGEEFTI